MSKGWRKSELTFEMVAPDGHRWAMSDIVNLEPAFQQVRRSEKDMKEISGIPDYARGVSHAADAMQYAASTRFVDRPQFPGKQWTPYEKLKMRLNLTPGDTFGLDYCNIFESPNRTYVFVVKGDKALVLEDDPNLFPSDSLVGQFQLFRSIE